ncbi:MAG: hypothetical protein ABIK09_05855 [Pseudomonadota bacterium]
MKTTSGWFRSVTLRCAITVVVAGAFGGVGCDERPEASGAVVGETTATTGRGAPKVGAPALSATCQVRGWSRATSGHCTFMNAGDAPGALCGHVEIRCCGALLNREALCSGEVLPASTVKTKFEMAQSSNKAAREACDGGWTTGAEDHCAAIFVPNAAAAVPNVQEAKVDPDEEKR